MSRMPRRSDACARAQKQEPGPPRGTEARSIGNGTGKSSLGKDFFQTGTAFNISFVFNKLVNALQAHKVGKAYLETRALVKLGRHGDRTAQALDLPVHGFQADAPPG